MRLVALTLMFILTGVQLAQAGPWLREKGKAFYAGSGNVTQQKDTSGSLYAEYGLRENITIGVNVFYGIDRTLQQSGSAILFARFPLSAPDATYKWAWHLGLGARSQNLAITPAFEAGLSWGRGIKIGEKYGWAVIDSSVNVPGSKLATRLKIDGTVGLGFTDHIKGMMQIFTTYQDSELFTKAAPSLLIQPGGGAYTFQIGAEIPMSGGGDAALKIGMWREF